jgi:hypothetical protein
VFLLAVIEIILLAFYVLECRLLVDMSVHLIDLDLVEILGIKQVSCRCGEPYLSSRVLLGGSQTLMESFLLPFTRSWSVSENLEQDSILSTGPISRSSWFCSSSARYALVGRSALVSV